MIFPIILRGTMPLAGLMDGQSRVPNAALGFDFMKSAFSRIVNPDGGFTAGCGSALAACGCGKLSQDTRQTA